MKYLMASFFALWASTALSFEIDVGDEDLKMVSGTRTIAEVGPEQGAALVADLCQQNGRLVIAERTPLLRDNAADAFDVKPKTFDVIERHADGSLHLLISLSSFNEQGEKSQGILERLSSLEAIRTCQGYFVANEPMVSIETVNGAARLSDLL